MWHTERERERRGDDRIKILRGKCALHAWIAAEDMQVGLSLWSLFFYTREGLHSFPRIIFISFYCYFPQFRQTRRSFDFGRDSVESSTVSYTLHWTFPAILKAIRYTSDNPQTSLSTVILEQDLEIVPMCLWSVSEVSLSAGCFQCLA